MGKLLNNIRREDFLEKYIKLNKKNQGGFAKVYEFKDLSNG